MSIAIRLPLVVLTCITLSATANAQYYYGLGERRPLLVDSNLMRVRFEDGLDLEARNIIYASLSDIQTEVEGDPNMDGFVTILLREEADYGASITALAEVVGVELVEPCCVSPDGERLVMGLRFCVGFDPSLSRQEIDDINARYGVEFDRELYGMSNVVVLRNTPETAMGLLDIANTYYELDETYFAQPSVSGAGKLGSYQLEDQYHAYCTRVKEVIGQFNVRTVWDFAGLADSLTVAVVDDGVTYHPDLPPTRILPGYECVNGGADATPAHESATVWLVPV